MKGYRNNEKANAEVFYHHDGKRYFRTGDQGQMVEGKFLKITGRINETFKLENGKFVVPTPLEDAFARCTHVAQVFIYGVNRPHTVALIVPSWPEVAEWYASSPTSISAPMPTAKELADPSIEHFAIFDDPAFIKMMTEEVRVLCYCYYILRSTFGILFGRMLLYSTNNVLDSVNQRGVIYLNLFTAKL